MAKMGRPRREFDRKVFVDLVMLGCTQEEICWQFRDERGKPANIDTLTRWVKREFGVTFQEFFRQNGRAAVKMQLRKNLFALSKTNASVAIFLAKNYLGMRDSFEIEDKEALNKLDEILSGVKKEAHKGHEKPEDKKEEPKEEPKEEAKEEA